MLSETCTPLYHPALLWAQLMAEGPLSRVGDEPVEDARWNHMMETPYFAREHFRKSSQWVTLSRAHAEIVALDQHVYPQFRMYCRTQVRRDNNAKRKIIGDHAGAGRVRKDRDIVYQLTSATGHVVYARVGNNDQAVDL